MTKSQNTTEEWKFHVEMSSPAIQEDVWEEIINDESAESALYTIQKAVDPNNIADQGGEFSILLSGVDYENHWKVANEVEKAKIAQWMYHRAVNALINALSDDIITPDYMSQPYPKQGFLV